MRHLVTSRTLVFIGVLVLIAAPVWAGPTAGSGGGNQGDPPTGDKGVDGTSLAAHDSLSTNPGCFFDPIGTLGDDLEAFWDCIDDPWQEPQYTVTPQYMLWGPPWAMTLLQIGIEIEDNWFNSQEICFKEENYPMKRVWLKTESGTVNHIARIRKFDTTYEPSGEGSVYISLNEGAEIEIPTRDNGALTSAELNTAILEALILAGHDVQNQPDHIHVLHEGTSTDITAISVRVTDGALIRIELAIENAFGPFMGLNCSTN